jgi:hypothetical protein
LHSFHSVACAMGFANVSRVNRDEAGSAVARIRNVSTGMRTANLLPLAALVPAIEVEDGGNQVPACL